METSHTLHSLFLILEGFFVYSLSLDLSLFHSETCASMHLISHFKFVISIMYDVYYTPLTTRPWSLPPTRQHAS
jgi:hypothetical protein